MDMPLPPHPPPPPPGQNRGGVAGTSTAKGVGIGCAVLVAALFLLLVLSILAVTFLGEPVDEESSATGTTDAAEVEPTVPDEDEFEPRATTTERETPTTTEAPLNSYDAAVDDGSLYDELVAEMGQEMADTVVETGELVCDNIDDLGVTRAMEIAGAAMFGSSDEEIEFLSAAIYVGVGIVCPEHVDAVNEWAQS